MRRFVTETRYKSEGVSLQTVVIYPTAINKKQVKKEMGPATRLKGIVIKENNHWRYEEL